MAPHWHHTLPPSVQVNPRQTSNFPKIFHPTHASLSTKSAMHENGARPEAKGRNEGVISWTSRNHRKHRYVQRTSASLSRKTSRQGWRKLANLGRAEYWNISWWVAIAFTLGSIVWTINGFASFLPFCDSKHFQTAPETMGWTAFLGATLFEFGSVFGIWEAWNRNDEVMFGEGVKDLGRRRDRDHGDANERPGVERDPSSSEISASSETRPVNDVEKGTGSNAKRQRWVWFSTDPKFWREAGFLAAFFQLCGATIFWISGFTGIPTIQESIMEKPRLWAGAYWTPQVIGGSGFIISSTFIMLETQEKWYKIRPLNLGWHVGLWNFIGGLGFTLCGIFGYYSADTTSWQAYESSLSTFWGSWAFLIGSIAQWYESVNSV